MSAEYDSLADLLVTTLRRTYAQEAFLNTLRDQLLDLVSKETKTPISELLSEFDKARGKEHERLMIELSERDKGTAALLDQGRAEPND